MRITCKHQITTKIDSRIIDLYCLKTKNSTTLEQCAKCTIVPILTSKIIKRPDPRVKPAKPAKPKMPSIPKEAWNLATSIAKFIVRPGFVTKEAYEVRLNICNTCEARNAKRCSECGCFITIKAKGRAWTCDKWPSQCPPCTLRLNTICNHPGAESFAEEVTPDQCDQCKERT